MLVAGAVEQVAADQFTEPEPACWGVPLAQVDPAAIASLGPQVGEGAPAGAVVEVAGDAGARGAVLLRHAGFLVAGVKVTPLRGRFAASRANAGVPKWLRMAGVMVVGATRFELATSGSQSQCSTKLSYAPTGRRRLAVAGGPRNGGWRVLVAVADQRFGVAAGPGGQGGAELSALDGFGEEVVHAGCQAGLAVGGKGRWRSGR